MGVWTSEGTENQMRWDRRATRFMEVWYATLNHRDSGAGIWLRYTLTAPDRRYGDPYCEVWGFAFDPDGKRTFAGKDRFPITALSSEGRDEGAIVRIGDSWLSENHLEGRVERDGGSLAWSLDFEPATRCFQHLPARLRPRLEKRVSVLCSPNLSVPFSGTVTVGDETLRFDGDRGCQSHRWGRAHASTWTWGHCDRFDDEEDAIFEGVAAKASFGPLPGPTLAFIYLRLAGEELVFNDLRWALRARTSYEMPTWAFMASNDKWRVVGASRAHPDRLVQVTYADPDSSLRYCANSEIADLALEVYERTKNGWRHRRSLTSTRTSHLEFGRKEPFEELPLAF
ncbi:MAG TPA: hypothetical protein VFS18_05070 [Actinomycetota bacterium]|nr:hypothetical protein [Actinomycetota bacterium]